MGAELAARGGCRAGCPYLVLMRQGFSPQMRNAILPLIIILVAAGCAIVPQNPPGAAPNTYIHSLSLEGGGG